LRASLNESIGYFLDLVEAAKHYPTLKKEWVEFFGERRDRSYNSDRAVAISR